ncbi:hypothetical protein [Thermoplasma volcanium GSS1]|uniref:DUF72 domain-containing protein n=1 Tax=Thermoplasma volcanium (strain ATCC 51530 / DSM 4299 / JCM 9571 / NBRC 15438 / GSS1) TaxID=273116 RepID=Q979L7_THEVO|nr:DUF72 domain-containing protein [Thermoplasma volcanium]BAB60285.1 hypothetical protein [Thermoplasma volcanium GSS1]
MIFVGCSGWSYEEWNGVFYPKSKINKLKFYSTMFNTVEVNSTFYREINNDIINRWIETVRGKNFIFSIKVPQNITHKAILEKDSNSKSLYETFIDKTVRPIRNARMLGAVLVQLPPSFNSNLQTELLDTICCENEYRTAVEVRNKDLYSNEELRKELEKRGIAIVDVDSTEHPLSNLNSGLKWSYVRLHGRAQLGWKSQNPYDYRYSEQEISDLSSKIMAKNYDEIFVYFNNHPRGSAPINALKMASCLGISNNWFF